MEQKQLAPANTNQIQIQNTEVMEMAKSVFISKLFPGANTEAQMYGLLMLCQSEGLHPMQAIKRYDIVEGRPALKAAAIQADFQADGGRIVFKQRDDKACEATFEHPYGAITIRITFLDLNSRGITKGRNGQIKANYARHPRQMLHARCVSEGIRAICPKIVVGMYTAEEMQDIVDEEKGNAPAVIPIEHEPIDTVSEETTEEEKAAKALRAKMNKEFQASQTQKEIRSICTSYQKIHGPNIWGNLTAHNETETFQDLSTYHIRRIENDCARHTPEAHKEWRSKLNDCLEESDIVRFIQGYQSDCRYHTDDNCSVLTDQAKNFQLWDDENSEFIIPDKYVYQGKK